MRLQIVTLEQARKLKEVGFNWRVQGSYTEYITNKKHREDGYDGPFGWKKGEVETDDSWFENNNKVTDYSNKGYIMYARPTVALALKWLWDARRLLLWIEPFDDDQVCYLRLFCNAKTTDDGDYICIHNPSGPSHSPFAWPYSDYEKAESVGLDWCLDYLLKEKK